MIAALAGHDAFAALGGWGGDAKNELAALGIIALGHLVILHGARSATAPSTTPPRIGSIRVGRKRQHH